ncbi:MAG: hypothetical protein ACEQSA_02205 [Weeksellaceae bacterium]
METTRHNLSVLNADKPDSLAQRILDAETAGFIELVEVNSKLFEVPRLKRYNVFVMYTVKTIKGEPSEFDGWFIGEELSGHNPQLILPPEEVTVL